MFPKTKIVWLHSFDPKYVSSGIFMYQQVSYLKAFEIEFVYVNNLFNFFNFFKKFFIYRNKFKDNIIHVQYGSGIGLFASLLNSKGKVITLRGSDWYLITSGTFKEKVHSRIAHLATSLSLYRFDRIVVMSEHMKADIIKKFPALSPRVNVITDGVDVKKFVPENKSVAKRIIENLIECDIHKKWVLFSSIHKINGIKRFEIAKEAFQLAKSKFPEIELHFMQGFSHEEVVHMINACDLILLTSIYEGWPNIIKEGLACNVPFVSTDVSDLIEVADKTSNCYVCPANSDFLAEKIVESLGKPEENLRELVLEFDIKNKVEALEELYRQLYQKL